MRSSIRARLVAAWAAWAADPGNSPSTTIEKMFGIVGPATLRSPSPRLHNSAYRMLGLPAAYLPFATESFAELWQALAAGEALADVGALLHGLTVVAPHKETAFEIAGPRASSDIVRRAGAANLLVRTGANTWRAESTDPQGVLDPLRRLRVEPRGRRVAVVGCGGSGRAVAAALDQVGARVVVVNRGRPRGRDAAGRLGLPFVLLSDFDPCGFAVVVHATPAGGGADDEAPFEVGRLDPDAVIVDLVYASQPTKLVAEARRRGLRVVDGREVLLAQTSHQLRAMTGRDLAPARLRSLLGC